MTMWAAISWYSGGPVIALNGCITAGDYIDFSSNQVYQMVQMLFPNSDAVFQDDSSPIHTTKVFSLGLRSMTMDFNIFPGQHNHQT